MASIALNKPMQIGSKIVIVRESDIAGIYGVYQIVPGERRDPRLGWIGVCTDAVDHSVSWTYHQNQDAMPSEPERWGSRFGNELAAIKWLVNLPPVSQDPHQEIAASSLKTITCSRCGGSLVWLTDPDGKSVTADAIKIEVIADDGSIFQARTLHAATCRGR